MRIAPLALIGMLSVFAAVPLFAHAQAAGTTLRDAIRAELLSDPRSAGLSQAQLDAMTDILTGEAQRQGITAADLAYHPRPFGEGVAVGETTDACAGAPVISCVFDLAFGFVGPDPLIPYILGAASMALIWLLAEMLHRDRRAHQFAAMPQPAPPAASEPPIPTL